LKWILSSTTSFSVGPNETSTPVPQKSVQFDDRVLECESDTSSYRDFKSPDYVVREPSSILSPTQPKSPSSAQFSPNSDGSLAYSTTQEPSTLIIRRQHRERSLQEILSKDQNTGAEQPPDTVPWRPTSAADDKGRGLKIRRRFLFIL
jgi:hypothetical protein